MSSINALVKPEANDTYVSSLFFSSLAGQMVSSSAHARSALTGSPLLGPLPTRASFSLRQALEKRLSRQSRAAYSS